MTDHLERYRRELKKKLAYQYWERRGRPLGSPQIDWSSAERAIDPYLLASGQESPTLEIRLEPNEGPFRSFMFDDQSDQLFAIRRLGNRIRPERISRITLAYYQGIIGSYQGIMDPSFLAG